MKVPEWKRSRWTEMAEIVGGSFCPYYRNAVYPNAMNPAEIVSYF
jgi:hypothetical protein